ncbi:MAG TPA: hypothetical protein VNA15_04675 [Candidatus Angelobacter sp.]|nr:hypothetical protein [Candidatus Angelobacter sp.]
MLTPRTNIGLAAWEIQYAFWPKKWSHFHEGVKGFELAFDPTPEAPLLKASLDRAESCITALFIAELGTLLSLRVPRIGSNDTAIWSNRHYF